MYRSKLFRGVEFDIMRGYADVLYVQDMDMDSTRSSCIELKLQSESTQLTILSIPA